MNDSNTSNLHAVVKQVNKFDGKWARDVLDKQTKLCTTFSLYSRCIINGLQGVQLPSSEKTDSATDRAIWDSTNQTLFCVLFLTTSRLAFSVVRRFEEGGLKMDQYTVTKSELPYARNCMAVHERHCVRSIAK